MAKFPSQNKLTYESGQLSNDSWTSFGYLNLPKDLSILNRRGYASTDRKGVPLVYRVKFDLFSQDFSGTGVMLDASGGTSPSDTTDEVPAAADHYTTASILTCQNNWVFRNAAVKWHAAREKMMRDAGIPKKHRGAYAHEIRYNFDTNSQTWMSPIDGDGDAFAGGTWDVSTLAFSGDKDVQLKLTGTAFTEDSALSGESVQNMAYAYLASRATVPADSNVETNLVPADFSLLRELLNPIHRPDSTDEIDAIAEDEADNPPYHEFNASTTNHDVTEPVESGRLVSSIGSGIGSTIVDVPFGLARIKARHFGADDQNIVSPCLIKAEVLQIYEMQG